MPDNPVVENSKLRGMSRRTAIQLISSVVSGVAFTWFLTFFLRPHSKNAPQTLRIARAAELFQNGNSAVAVIEGKRYAFTRTNNEITSVLLTCTHSGCPLTLKHKRIECVCHGGVFSLQGKTISGPPKQNLSTLQSWLNNGDVYVRLPGNS